MTKPDFEVGLREEVMEILLTEIHGFSDKIRVPLEGKNRAADQIAGVAEAYATQRVIEELILVGLQHRSVTDQYVADRITQLRGQQ